MSTYLYGVVRAPQAKEKLHLPTEGVGNPPARPRLLRHRELAALVGDVPDDYHAEAEGLRGMRRDMRIHAAVLNRVIESHTVLPFRFGVVLPDDGAVVEQILRGRYARLEKYLDALDGAVEVTLRAGYVEERVLEEVVSENPRLVASGSGRRVASSYASKLETGRRIAAALQAKSHHDANWLIDTLRPYVRDLRVGETSNDLMVLSASLLVDRKDLPKFDRVLERINAHESGRMQLDCLGPLPPYSFVELKL